MHQGGKREKSGSMSESGQGGWTVEISYSVEGQQRQQCQEDSGRIVAWTDAYTAILVHYSLGCSTLRLSAAPLLNCSQASKNG